jgi:hypothetical protein
MASAVVVARNNSDGLEYLAEGAREAWTEASEMALRFQNIREATRAAMRLPAKSRAFALPVYAEA